MAHKSKEREKLIKMQCQACKRFTYYTHKNKKTVEKKLELSKHCLWCHKHTPHKEAKK